MLEGLVLKSQQSLVRFGVRGKDLNLGLGFFRRGRFREGGSLSFSALSLSIYLSISRSLSLFLARSRSLSVSLPLLSLSALHALCIAFAVWAWLQAYSVTEIPRQPSKEPDRGQFGGLGGTSGSWLRCTNYMTLHHANYLQSPL